MCSIAGAKDKKKVEEMLELMKHRAPDGSKFVADDNFTIGMGRLAIIDLKSPGLYPYEEDNFKLAFNGEIYNFIELRLELERKGHVFKTNSDTEVLLKSFKEWGLPCLDKFNGMFAFAVYDGRLVYMARDIAGEKPLYYTEKPFQFASEAKALNFDCKEFPPAHVGVFDIKTGEWLIFRKWWHFKPHRIEDPLNELEGLLASSIMLRTRSNVPYGLYLSDGIDSNLINTFHRFKHTFSFRKDAKNKFGESRYKKHFLEVFDKIVWHLDYPISSFSAFPLWLLAERAHRAGVKVILSGEGADELFGGYIRYLPDALYEQAQNKFPSYKSMFPIKKTLDEWCWDEFNGNLRELLRMGDRMASAWGVENRCPFLDRRIIEFAFSLIPEQKLDGFTTKVLLRKILAKRNPFYTDVEKNGLFADVNSWIGSKDGYGKNDYLAMQCEIFNHFSNKK